MLHFVISVCNPSSSPSSSPSLYRLLSLLLLLLLVSNTIIITSSTQLYEITNLLPMTNSNHWTGKFDQIVGECSKVSCRRRTDLYKREVEVRSHAKTSRRCIVRDHIKHIDKQRYLLTQSTHQNLETHAATPKATTLPNNV